MIPVLFADCLGQHSQSIQSFTFILFANNCHLCHSVGSVRSYSVLVSHNCRKVWEYFLEICHEQNSLFGITWTQLRSSLDRVEVAKSYVLNPLAPEFVPNRPYHITLQVQEASPGNIVQPGSAMPYLVNQYQYHPVVQPNPYQVGVTVGKVCR